MHVVWFIYNEKQTPLGATWPFLFLGEEEWNIMVYSETNSEIVIIFVLGPHRAVYIINMEFYLLNTEKIEYLGLLCTEETGI